MATILSLSRAIFLATDIQYTIFLYGVEWAVSMAVISIYEEHV